MIRLIELFGGIGSQAKALKNINADFEHYRMIELDEYAMASYNAIHNTNFETSDITEITANDLGIVETDKYTYLTTYSFPCQDLSVAGKQAGMEKGSGTRSGLLWEVERLLNECEELPQILFMENVPQVHGKKSIDNFNKWREFLESKGYTNYWQDLNAKNYGVPQNRNRCFMVSFIDGRDFKFPEPFELKTRLEDVLEPEVDEKYLLTNKEILFLKEKTDNDLIQVAQIKESFEQSGRIYSANGISPTVMSNSHGKTNGGYNAPKIIDGREIVRKLTPKECWRLMGFDDADFEKAQAINSNTQLYKQAGNSIVVPVLEEIFKTILYNKNIH